MWRGLLVWRSRPLPRSSPSSDGPRHRERPRCRVMPHINHAQAVEGMASNKGYLLFAHLVCIGVAVIVEPVHHPLCLHHVLVLCSTAPTLVDMLDDRAGVVVHYAVGQAGGIRVQQLEPLQQSTWRLFQQVPACMQMSYNMQLTPMCPAGAHVCALRRTCERPQSSRRACRSPMSPCCTLSAGDASCARVSSPAWCSPTGSSFALQGGCPKSHAGCQDGARGNMCTVPPTCLALWRAAEPGLLTVHLIVWLVVAAELAALGFVSGAVLQWIGGDSKCTLVLQQLMVRAESQRCRGGQLAATCFCAALRAKGFVAINDDDIKALCCRLAQISPVSYPHSVRCLQAIAAFCVARMVEPWELPMLHVSVAFDYLCDHCVVAVDWLHHQAGLHHLLPANTGCRIGHISPCMKHK
jgi:hypothetical protein